MYHYIRSEPGLWTVGTGTPRSQGGTDWEPESDHDSPDKAAARVRWLNGGPDESDAQASVAEATTRAERYRLAWMSARRRAAGHKATTIQLQERDALLAITRTERDKALGVSAARLLALEEVTQQRDEARAALADEQSACAMTESSFEIFVESMREQEAKLREQIQRLQDDAIAHAKRHQAIFDDCLRQIAELTDERDEAQAKAVRLGKELEDLRGEP